MIPNEQVIETINKVGVTLTTHRIRQIVKQNNEFHITSIMLDEICSCELTYHHNLLWIVLAVLALIVSCYVGFRIGLWGYTGILLSLLCVVIYILTRKSYIVVSSGGVNIETESTNLPIDYMESFIEKIEIAKNDRYYSRTGPQVRPPAW